MSNDSFEHLLTLLVKLRAIPTDVAHKAYNSGYNPFSY